MERILRMIFEIKNNVLQIIMDGKILESVKKSKSPNYDYCWEPKNVNNVINLMPNLTVDSFPDGLMIADTYKSNAFDKITYVSLQKKHNKVKIHYSITFEYKDWSSFFTLPSLAEPYKRKLEEIGSDVKIYDDEYGLIFEVCDNIENGNLINSIEKFAFNAKIKFLVLEKELLRDSKSELIVKVFQFPHKFENICSQYVLWFGELLSNIGIEADVSTENKDGYTFLTISPHENNTFKADIEKTLYSYLSLPYSEYIPTSSGMNDINSKILVQSLQQQVMFFTQQCEIKNSIIELQDFTNKKLNTELTSANKKISLLESLKSDNIELFNGAISLVEYRVGPIIINPKKILEKIKK